MNDNNLRVAILGRPGTYSEAAAAEFFGDTVQSLFYSDFEGIFQAVTKGEAERGILPVENSLAGSIHRNYDLLLRHNLFIVGEIQIHIATQLIVLPGVTLDDVKKVYSHPQPLVQCDLSLSKLLPQAKRIPTHDTSGSVKMLKEQNITDGAALASERAANIYGMDILQYNMQDNTENYTRFVIVGQEAIIPAGEAKTTIVYSVDNVPGALFKSMAVFALRDIDLAKIESRPLQGKRWEYFFYLDFIGSCTEERCQNALNNLQEFTSYFKILGSYPRGVYPRRG